MESDLYIIMSGTNTQADEEDMFNLFALGPTNSD